jgi:hypothetical protein
VPPRSAEITTISTATAAILRISPCPLSPRFQQR